MASDDYEQASVRIYKLDHRVLRLIQMEREPELHRKPSFAELIHEAIRKLERAE